MLALVGEVGELAELFQWQPDARAQRGLPDFSAKERQSVAEEMADVLLYLVRAADVCGIDLAQAALDKAAKNGMNYPIEACKGSSAKYTQLPPRGVKRERSSGADHDRLGVATPGAAAPGSMVGLLGAGGGLAGVPTELPQVAGGGAGPSSQGGAAAADYDEEVQKRKRFTESQIEALSQYAEAAGWSLSSLTMDEVRPGLVGGGCQPAFGFSLHVV